MEGVSKSSNTELPNIRRVVTGHDLNLVAKVILDGTATNTRVSGGKKSTLIWCSDSAPADIQVGETIEDLGSRKLGTSPPEKGTRFTVNDIPPNGVGVMHRTETLDYVIVMSGELDLVLDHGKRIHMKAGDVAVQRGTNHAWENKGKTTARVAFVLIDAKPIGIGEPLRGQKSVGEN